MSAASDVANDWPDGYLDDLVTRAMAEDSADADATSLALIPPDATTVGIILARSDCVVCGTEIARRVFAWINPAIQCEVRLQDGARAGADATILRITGPAGAILSAERTALNFMQRLSGTATLTAAFVQAVRPYGTLILDTRKTTPGLRLLEKYAVKCGGGTNHRMGLADRILIKDNHRRFWRSGDSARLDLAVREARRKYPDLLVEVEVESLAELESALAGAPDWVLLDNMTPDLMRECVRRCKGRTRTEASGGITLDNVVAAAASGVDAISLGCLTHSARAVDLSLELCDEETHPAG